ncbi:MAG: hypothetical protein V7609_3290 [Verrucomicrobiota bacterium]
MAHDVFVSHSAKDKTVSDALVARLEAEGIRCWVAPRDVVPGADWGESIIDAIESSRIMVLIFSASANGSPQIKREIERAVDKGVYTIPFRIEDVRPTKAIEYFISSAHWLDAFSQPLGEHLDSLAKTIKAILTASRPSSAPEMAPPFAPQFENTPVSVPDVNRSQAQRAPEPVRFPAAPPPPPVEKPRPLSPASAAPQPPKKTMTPVILVILAVLVVGFLLIAGVVVLYLIGSNSKQETKSTPSQVSSSPAPTALSPQTSSTVGRKPSPSSQAATSPAPNDPKLKPPAVENTDGVPSEKELKKLALDTLLLFNDAVQTKSFKAFHAELGTAWKKETTARRLQEIFHEFVDKNIDFADIADVDPTFDGFPSIEENGWLVIKGHYTLPASDVLFEVKYENEEASWKLVALNVQTKPHRR